ncbi:pyridoxal-phosphate dependent enzyme [uncultured Microbulbifer sp.]|uniref:pyridoxal-phosphate dependent enzyme n=1 Tax=uncultured Microbulbifer sp. TaxID=348147 RepID=UPI002606A3BE|nr:pyridoxal-phosphate dependent enzyme [uncultured Microbulbifer sp.]
MIHSHISEAIKEPDLIHLNGNLYFARFESMKVYSTLAAVEYLLESGVVKRGQTLLDSSSGIYAYALALACHKYGLNCHIVASKTVDPALKLQLEILGATVEPAASAPNLKMDQNNRVRRIQEILQQRDDVHWMQQYHDSIHYLGYREFACLLANKFSEEKLTLVGGVGSGCSTGATAGYLREMGRKVSLHGVQPFGSVTFNSQHVEDPDIIIAGIGSSIPFMNVRASSYDYIHWISFDYSRHGSIELLKKYAAFSGLSTGSCYTVAQWCANIFPDDGPCIFIGADLGYRYLEPVFSTYKGAEDVSNFQPRVIESTNDLSLDWCIMDWRRHGVYCDQDSGSGAIRRDRTADLAEV